MHKKYKEELISLRQQTTKASKWFIGGSFLQKIISFSTTIVLARILSPGEFGLFALAFVVIDGFSLFKSMGFDAALVQRQGEIRKAANTAFFIIPSLGAVLYILLVFMLPLFESFFQTKELIEVLKFLGLIFIINSFGRVPIALLEKQIKFKKIALIEIIGQVVFSLVAITIAVIKASIWALVFGYLSMTMVKLVMLWIVIDWRPKLEFDKNLAKDMFHYGKYVFLTCLIVFLQRNFDRIIIGKILGIVELGMYSIAYNLANLPNEYLGNKMSRILFAAYSKVQNDLVVLKNAFLKVIRIISSITIPFGVGIIMLGGDFLILAFGENWIGAIPILEVLVWSGVFNTFIVCNRSVFLALKKSKLGFLIISLQVIIYIFLVWPVANSFGSIGVSWVVTITAFLIMIISFLVVARLIKLRMKDLVSALMPSIFSGVIMFVSLIILKYFFARFLLPNWIEFFCLLIVSIAIYARFLFKTDKIILLEIKEIFAS